METKHQTVRDYIAARERGDRAEADRLKDEAIARFNTRTTDGTELRDMTEASMTIPFGEGA
ncbi:hypothetical protein ABZX95_17255 [Streptomyces sp. NPDC004232]|uniref:hypothetical protein n=1 Tax=Streptomyces sp. NPDC004232 TaxID=3154454 RepID=UPI0033B6B5CC